MHLSQEYVRLVRLLADRLEGGGMETSPSNLVVPPAARARSAALLGSIGVTTSYAVLGPGAIFGPAKRWSPVRFAELGRILVRDGLAILVCGAAADRDICLEVARGIGPEAHSLAGVTDLEVQAGVCAGARVVVTNDSGLGHLAAAVGASTVSLFGSTSSGWTAPLGEHVRVVQHAPVCAPCFQRTCRIGYLCLERIDTERVATACRELLAA
jgi:heptosyltransferase-2